MTPYIEIIKGPHLLFVGANGHKTYGITVRRTDNPPSGYLREWDINDSVMSRNGAIESLADKTGLYLAEVMYMALELQALAENQI